MKARKLLMFLVFLTSLAGSPATIFRGAEISRSECKGVLKIFSGDKEYEIREDTPQFEAGVMRMEAGRDRLVMEGCGCFLVFQRPGKTGRAYMVGRPGHHSYSLHIIGSVYREECERTEEYMSANVPIFLLLGVAVFLTACLTAILLSRTTRKHPKIPEHV